MEKIVLALSGGVDSAVAVHLLKEQGYDVYGYTFVTGDDEEKRKSIIDDAASVAKHFGISHYVEDISDEFDKVIVSYFADRYFSAKTPNPCVYCNKMMKFPKLLAYADKMGIEKVATGHYVSMKDGRIVKAEDKRKDQSYVLSLLPESLYSRFVFPLGCYEKPEIRNIAEKLGLSVAHKDDSQEICFIPNDDYKSYLTAHYPDRFVKGNFLDTDGNILGQHKGIPFYTIGQRRGIGLAFGSPKYVVRLNGKENAVIIGDQVDLFTDHCFIKDVNIIGTHDAVFDCTTKIRYLSEPVPAKVTVLENHRCRIDFEIPQKSVTPGQFVVLYEDDLLLGGGEIE